MIYVITNGEQYIRTNPNGRLAWSGNPTLANSFETFPAALGFLKTNRVQNFLKGNSRRSRVIELTDGYMPVEKPENCGEEDKNNINNIKSMDIDGLLKTPHLPDERNPYTYYNKLEVDILDVDMAGILQLASKIISEIDKQYENMRYLEKEMDLRICDTRHFKKNDDTKLSAIAAQRLEYYEQKLDVKRDIYKKNRLILELFKDDISKFKDKNFPNEIKAIKNTPYQYRRISYEVLKDYCNGKYRKEKKHETKRVSKTIRTGVQ